MTNQRTIIFLSYSSLLFMYTLFGLHEIYIKLLCVYHNCSPITGSEPKYQPYKWNNDMYIRYSHNCYAYALDDINMNLRKICEYKTCKRVNPQPGHYSKSQYKKHTCFQLNQNIKRDNPLIKNINFGKKCPKNYYKIGLATNINSYYHFYRQNKYGLWDHKDGGNKVNQYDASNKLIFNPKIADRNYDKIRNYKTWCNFYCVPKNEYKKTNMSRLRDNNLLY